MTPQEATHIVSQVSFGASLRSWGCRADLVQGLRQDSSPCWFCTVTFEDLPDRDLPDQPRPLSAGCIELDEDDLQFLTERGLLRIVLDRLIWFCTHEAMESLCYRGSRYFDPHDSSTYQLREEQHLTYKHPLPP